jgi:hypothetical protein
MIASRLGILRELRGSQERLLFVQVLGGASVVPVLMRLPLPTVERMLTARRRSRAGRGLAPERVAAVVDLAQRFGHPVVRAGCLTRGVSLFWLLRDPGRDGGLRLCFGLGGARDGFGGHCWLERDQRPYLERVDVRLRFPVQFAIPR